MSRTNRLLTPAGVILGAILTGVIIWPSIGPAVAQSDARPKAPAAGASDRPEDQASIRAAMQSFVKAFVAKDAKALAAHWTTQGEFHNDQGKDVKGRDALEKGFAEFFTKSPDVKAEVHAESLRFLSNDSAIEEGSVNIRRGPLESAGHARYHVMFVREQGRWLIARFSESGVDAESIADLGWLIGEWKSLGGQGAEIRTTYAWDANKKFIHVRFTYAERGRTLTGTQIIGVDPATGGFRTWTFEADGGVGVADWNRDGDHWELELVGALGDGRRLTETNLVRRVNADTMTFQSINRSLDGADIADLPPVKITRVKSEK